MSVAKRVIDAEIAISGQKLWFLRRFPSFEANKALQKDYCLTEDRVLVVFLSLSPYRSGPKDIHDRMSVPQLDTATIAGIMRSLW